ncbi:MAG: toxin-antitoxin system TumE family protein [Methanosarcinaceae archaeon]
MNELKAAESYERFIYSLQNKYPEIKISTLVLIRTGSLISELKGNLSFVKNIRLVVREKQDFRRHIIKGYSYEIWRGKQKLYWYDSQPHPDNPDLASSHPHHKHIPPDIKHNRISAPNLSFNSPNLPFLIQEIIDTVL